MPDFLRRVMCLQGAVVSPRGGPKHGLAYDIRCRAVLYCRRSSIHPLDYDPSVRVFVVYDIVAVPALCSTVVRAHCHPLLDSSKHTWIASQRMTRGGFQMHDVAVSQGRDVAQYCFRMESRLPAPSESPGRCLIHV
jgi:hypothetical protein